MIQWEPRTVTDLTNQRPSDKWWPWVISPEFTSVIAPCCVHLMASYGPIVPAFSSSRSPSELYWRCWHLACIEWEWPGEPVTIITIIWVLACTQHPAPLLLASDWSARKMGVSHWSFANCAQPHYWFYFYVYCRKSATNMEQILQKQKHGFTILLTNLICITDIFICLRYLPLTWDLKCLPSLLVCSCLLCSGFPRTCPVSKLSGPATLTNWL